MSFSKTIIFGSLNDVVSYMQRSVVRFEEIDEYGYTPLIQTAIVNDIAKARALIDAGADVNYTDLTGRTALHWAADNNNVELAELLLKQGADANAYTRAGQPVLALPYLRNQNEIKQLLYQYDGDLTFAQDFVNAKLLGHVFELEGRVDLVDTKDMLFEIEFEGFYLEFSLAIVARSLFDFQRNYGGKHLRPYFPKLQLIIAAIHNGAELLKYQHYLINIKKYEDKIDRLLNLSPLLIPIAADGHAISLIRFGDWLIRCDRGAFGRDHGTVIIYEMGQPMQLTKSLIKSLIYQRQTKTFINETLIKILELTPIEYIPLPVQLSGNCSWANIEATIPAIMYLLLLHERKKHTPTDIEDCKRTALYFYNEWQKWDKNRTLHFCVESFERASDSRKASIAAVLAAVLFQRCQFKNPEDRKKAEKIFPILTLHKYEYILKIYFKIFMAEKDHQLINNLLEFFEELGIDKKPFLP